MNKTEFRKRESRKTVWPRRVLIALLVVPLVALVGLLVWIRIIDWQDSKRPPDEIPRPSTQASQTGSPFVAKENAAKEKRPFQTVVVYSDEYLIDLSGIEQVHPFDIKKYRKITDQLLADGLLQSDEVRIPLAASRDELLLVHTEQYLEDLKQRSKVATFLEAPILNYVPVSLDRGILRPFRHATGGTILAARESLRSGIGINIGGGYHHAKPSKGEGFCIYADVPIAIRQLRSEQLIQRALVIDVDAHQGNGTIVCLRNDPDAYTFSIHEQRIYPLPKETGDRDVGLPAGINDDEYMKVMQQHLPEVLEQADPDICFLVAGCDTLSDDPLANFEMTTQGIVKRDALLVAACVEKDVPVVFTTAGGYSPDAWRAQYLSIKNLIETYGVFQE